MPIGYRFIIVAALGFVALYGFGLGYYHAALNYPQEQRYQPYRAAADQIGDVDPTLARSPSAKPFEYRTPCYEPKGKDESDLCAQWRAANAAEESALWTKWGVLIGVIGSCLLMWQIILTRTALEETGKATLAMIRQNELAEIGQRPYLVVEAGQSPTLPNERGFVMPASYSLTNYGGSPAKTTAIAVSIVVMQERNTFPEPIYPGKWGAKWADGEVVGAGVRTAARPAGPILDGLEKEGWPPCPLKAEGIYIKPTFFHGFVVYEDLEGRAYIRGFCFQYENGKFWLRPPDSRLNYERRCNPDGSPCRSDTIGRA